MYYLVHRYQLEYIELVLHHNEVLDYQKRHGVEVLRPILVIGYH